MMHCGEEPHRREKNKCLYNLKGGDKKLFSERVHYSTEKLLKLKLL